MTSRWATDSGCTVENPALGEQDSRVLQWATGAGAGWRFFSLDAVDGDSNRANCEILARFRVEGDDDNLFWAVGRASGSSGSENGYFAGMSSDGTIKIGRMNAGTFTSLVSINADIYMSNLLNGQQDNFNYSPYDVWLNCRFRINGTGATVTLQAKFWGQYAEEPEQWILEYADTDASRITGNGWVGQAKFNDTWQSYLDSIAVATNGDTALGTAGTENIRVTAANVNVLLQDDTTPVRVTAVNANVLLQDDAAPVRVTAVAVNVLYLIAPPRPQCVICTITQDYAS